MKTTELTPVQNQKSFYGKAKIINNGDISKLLSYDTEVAEYNHNTNKMTVNGWYSATTAKHINSFLEYFGFERCNKKELETYND